LLTLRPAVDLDCAAGNQLVLPLFQALLASSSRVFARGPIALWAGTVPALYAYNTEHAVIFGLWGGLKDAIWPPTKKGEHIKKNPVLLGLLCGLSATVSSFFLCPADAIKCRLQVGKEAQDGRWWERAKMIARETGYSGLWRNYPSVVMRDSVFFTVYLATQDSLAKQLCARTGRKRKHELSRFELFLCGGTGGAVAWSVASPADLVNSRRQSRWDGQPGGVGLFQEFRTIAVEEGLGVFWKGYSLQVMRGFLGYGAFAVGYSVVMAAMATPPPGG